MDKISNLVKRENPQPEYISAYYKNVLLNGFQTSPREEEFVAMKTWLEDEDKRPDGLFLLQLIIPECSNTDLKRNVMGFMHCCCQTINGLFSVTTKQLACSIVKMITLRMDSVCEMKKETAEKCLPLLVIPIVDLSFKEMWLDAGLDLLAVLMDVFQHHCFKFKCHIEDFLMGILKDLKFDDIEALANCISKLPMIKHQSSSLAHYKNSWREVMEHLTNFLRETWNKLYPWFETETNDPLAVAADFNDADMMAIVNDSLLYKAIVICLGKMLGFSKVPVEIPVGSLLKFVQIPVNYRPSNNKNEKLKFFEYNVLPNMQIASLLLLENLIDKFHRYLMRDAVKIVGMLGSLLNFASFNTADTKYYSQKASRIMRHHVYKVLHVMILKMNPGLSKEWLLDLFNCIIQDIDLLPPSSIESLQRLKMDIQQQLEKAFTNKTEVCIAALKVLSSIFFTCSSLEPLFVMKVESWLHKLFTVLRALLMPPYIEPSCRLQIYNLLKHVVLNKKMSRCTLLFAITIFQNGKMDHDLEVSSLCMESSKMCELFLSTAKVVSVPTPDPNDPTIAENQTLRQQLSDKQSSLFGNKILVAKCGIESNSILGYENDKAIVNGSGIQEPMYQNMERGRHEMSQDEELDYGYDDEEGGENAEDDDEDECVPAYNSYHHHQDSRRRKRSHHQYADDDEEEDDDEEDDDEEDEEDEAEEEDENEGEEEYEDETYDDDENGDERHNSLPVSNDSHVHSRQADIAVKTLNHSDHRVDREDEKDNDNVVDEEEQLANSVHSESTGNNDSMQLVINENGVNSSSSSSEREDKDFELPAPKRLKRFHGASCSAENDVEGFIAEAKEEVLMDGLNATEMLADFIDASPDVSQQNNPSAE